MSKTDFDRVNRFVLRKQHLTSESRIDDAVQIAGDISGLHATSPTTPYLSLYTRTPNFTTEQLDEELYIKRNLGKIRCMRTTVHVLPKEMIPIAYSATKRLSVPLSEKYGQYLGVGEKEFEENSKLILTMLKGKAMTAKEVKKALKSKLNISAIINLMCDKGLLIRGKPQSSWKSNIHTYHVFSEFLPDLNLDAINEAEARKLLTKRYIASFGPTTEKDIAWWAGFPNGEVKRASESLKNELTWVEISDLEANFLMLVSDWKQLQLQKHEAREVVNLLPSLDPYLMGYKHRERYLAPEHRDNVFDRSGNATSTILLNGKVIGVWDISEKPAPLVKLFLFEKVRKTVWKDIRSIAKRMGEFILNREVQIKECDSMIPLTRRTAGGVMSPLKGS
jgi:hypothetical protein